MLTSTQSTSKCDVVPIVRRVILCSEVKDLRSVAEVKASVNSTKQLHAIDPKPGDLSMSRLK